MLLTLNCTISTDLRIENDKQIVEELWVSHTKSLVTVHFTVLSSSN